MIQIKRIYDEPAASDGTRVLIDRLWPRGISKERAAIELWLKDIAPSTELRNWFGHRPERFAEFAARYNDELSRNPAVTTLEQTVRAAKEVTLLYAAKNPDFNQAVILRRFLEQKLG